MMVRGIISPKRSRPNSESRSNWTIRGNNNTSPPLRSQPVNPNSKSKKPDKVKRNKRKEAINTPNKNNVVNPSKPIKKLVNNSSIEPKPISQQPRSTPSNKNLKGGIIVAAGSGGSRFKLSSPAATATAKPSAAVVKPKYLHSPNGSLNPYLTGQSSSATLQDPDLHVRHQLQRFSIDGKDLANIVLQSNSIHGSDTNEDSSSQTNDSRMFQIYKKIASHRQENSSVASYFTKLEALWNELATFNTDLPQCSCGGSIEKVSEHMEREKVMQFLVGLNDSYSKICNQILVTNPFPTVEKAFNAIIQEEKHRELMVVLQTVAEKLIQNKVDNNDGVQELDDHSNNLQKQQ